MRMDSHLYAGYAVPPHYDSLLAKVVVWGKNRSEAVARMERALTETVITGITHTAPFQRRLVADQGFKRGDVHTGFLDSFLAQQDDAQQDAADREAAARLETGRGRGGGTA